MDADGEAKGIPEHSVSVSVIPCKQPSSAVLTPPSGLTGSGKSIASRHITSQILHLSSYTKSQRRVSDQINYLFTLLESFGHSKTPLNPSASQHVKYLELHFSSDGAVSGAKALPFGLNKSRLGRLRHDERSFHVFYQLLAGASPDERDALDLQDPSSYAVLAQSGCYRLPGGLFSDDAAQLGELRAAFASLGFKAKHVKSLFTLLTTILLLSNLTFVDHRGTGSLGMTSVDESARVEDRLLLSNIAGHLGVQPDELEAVLVNRTKWVRNDLCSMLLDANGAAAQRDGLMKDLYAILFTFVVEMANRKLAPSETAPELQIIQMDLPGYQTRTVERPQSGFGTAPLINASGQNGFDEFSVNYMNEVVHSYILKRAFEDDPSQRADGIKLPQVAVLDNAACVELLRGGLLGSSRLSRTPGGMMGLLSTVTDELNGEEREVARSDELLKQFNGSFARLASYVPHSGGAERSFGINHYSGPCIYDVSDFVERNNDVLDKQLVDLLRWSSDPFIAKLVSGPGLATEGHPMDANITVEAQVTVSPLRTPTPIVNPVRGAATGSVEWPIDNTIPQPVTTQLNATLSTLLSHMNQTRSWTVACIRPNDSGHPGSFDKRRVKSQVKSLMLPELASRTQVDYVADMPLSDFCARHGLNGGSHADAAQRFVESYGWTRGPDYEIGKSRIWFAWDAWKQQEDLIRRHEDSLRTGSVGETLAESEDEKRSLRLDVYGKPLDSSSEDLLLRRKLTEGTILSPNTPGDMDYKDFQETPDYPTNLRLYSDTKESITTPTYKEEDPLRGRPLSFNDGEGDGEMIVHEKKHHSTEVIATTPARRWWLRITWALTWWIPSFLLIKVGRMKRQDVRMAWREKVAIFIMILLMCGVVVFYIVGFGLLLCPDSAKAWNPSELAQHAGGDDYFAAIAGKVYDVSYSSSPRVVAS